MIILEESEGEEVAMNNDNSYQMALSDLDVEIDRDNQVKSDFLDKLDKLSYCQILARQEEIPQKTSKNISRYFCSSCQGHV